MTDNAGNKNKVRAWIYEILAELETCEDAEAHRVETAGRKVTIEIQFKV